MGKYFNIDVKSDISELTKKLTHIQREQIPFATAKALTSTIWNAREWAREGMVRDLESVKSYTLNAFKVTKATKRNLTATIEIKPVQNEYLTWQILGGEKTRKAISVPYDRPRMTRGMYKKWVARDDTFIGTIKGLRGLWQRTGRGHVKLLFAFESKVDYKAGKWNYYGDVTRTAQQRFPVHFERALIHALQTAK